MVVYLFGVRQECWQHLDAAAAIANDRDSLPMGVVVRVARPVRRMQHSSVECFAPWDIGPFPVVEEAAGVHEDIGFLHPRLADFAFGDIRA